MANLTQFAFINALIALGGMFGAIFAGPSATRWGRRLTMQILTVPLILSPIILALAPNYTMLILGRFLAGFGSGGSCAVVPMYLSEISPVAQRGRVGVLATFGLSFGLAFAGLLGYFFSLPSSWRLIFGFSLITSSMQSTLLFKVVESPVYLKSIGRTTEAHFVMLSMGASRTATPTEEVGDKESPFLEQGQEDKERLGPESTSPVPNSKGPTLVQFLFSSRYRRSLCILVAQHATQQLSGINALFTSAYDILVLALSPESAKLFYLIFTFYCIFLNFGPGILLDRYGRRPLLIGSSLGMSFFLMLFYLGSSWKLSGIALVGFVCGTTAFSVGLSSVPYIMTAEVVLPNTVGVAAQVSMVVNTLCSVRNFKKIIECILFL
jgi:MFS family permease